MDCAQRIASSLLDRRLAVCVSMLPGLISMYRWEGAIEQSKEVLMLIKTTRDLYKELEQAIVSQHPYELPEIIAVPVERGLAGYLAWVEKCTKTMT